MGQEDADQETLPREKVRELLLPERSKLMDSLLVLFQTFKDRATFLQRSVLFLCVHCLKALFVLNCQNDFSVVTSTPVSDLVYAP